MTELVTSNAPAVASASTRTVEGLILPYGERGSTTGGALTFAAGAVKIPKEIGRVKLFRDHTGQPQHAPAGHAVEIIERPAGLYGRFQISTTDDGNTALKDVQEKVRDAFSVELTNVKRQGATVVNAHLTAVALVAVPAYHNARVETISAAHTENGDTPMADEDYTPAPTEDDDQDAGSENRAPERPAAQVEDDGAQHSEPATPEGSVQAGNARRTRGVVTPAYMGTRKPELSMSQAANAVLAIQTGGTVHAELADITGTAMGDAEAPGWLGELWAGTAYQRRYAPLVTNRALTNWRVNGWRWVTKPTVDKYAGDKADIPTNTPTIEDFEAVATRWAGGHDLDRKFYDFKETQFLASYWRAMAEDYAKKSDQAIADYIIANARAAGSASSVWDAMFAAAEELDEELNVAPTFYIGNPADRRALANMTMNTAPAALDLLGVDLKRIEWSSKVPAGKLIAGHKAAVVNSELAGSPLRVEAEHIAKGGRDAALFGYQAIYSENPGGLVSVTIGATGGGE